MPNIYITIGILNDDIKLTKDILESLFSTSFEEHESDYWGEYIITKLSTSEEIKVGYNYIDDDWREEDYKQCPLLIELINPQNPEEITKCICDNFRDAIPIRMMEIEPNSYVKNYIFKDGKFCMISKKYLKK